MNSVPLRRWIRTPGIGLLLFLFLALLVINTVAVWEIVSSRRSAEAIALQDLRLQTTAHARSLEAVLASRRGDFIFLSQSPPVASTPSVLSSRNPMTRRWGRLDVQGTLLLFLGAHPEVEAIILRDSAMQPLVAIGRREGAPVALAVQNLHIRRDPKNFFDGTWPLGPSGDRGGTMEVVLSVPKLLEVAAPGIGPNYSLLRRPASAGTARPDRANELVVFAPVQDAGWNPTIHWTLVHRENESRLIESVALLAGRYRTTVFLNLLVMTLALLLGAVAVRQVRRRVVLEAQSQHQALVREVEKKLMDSERLASLGRLAAGMAHEINNPLEGMSNYLSLLKDDLRSGTTGEAVDTVERLREGLDRAAGIIRQVLTYSDPGTAPQVPVDANEILGEAVVFVQTNPAFRHLTFSVQTAQGQLRVLGNRTTLAQLFLNLLINACQLQPAAGQVEVTSVVDGAWVVISVSDRGPGIPTDVLPHIFEPFYSTRGSTGLGLSVCHGIVLQHGGQIGAENRVGGGASFQVRLPMTAASVALGDQAVLAERI